MEDTAKSQYYTLHYIRHMFQCNIVSFLIHVQDCELYIIIYIDSS